ncbi:MAG TPA: hypothetical protein PKK10_06315 [Woeseiaceae bacterium]|nr:hypothetical protein [Woeseiaceae bacterium]
MKSINIVAALAALLLTACGDDATSPPDTTAGNSASSAAVTDSPDSFVNSLEFSASGDAQGELHSDGADIMLVGGCDENTRLSMSFNRGEITDKNLFQLRFTTDGAVGSGGTGNFELSELGWYNGQFAPEDLPANLNILVPDAYEGAGTLTLTTHTGSGMNGRMAGTIKGVVGKRDEDVAVNIDASFDINLACQNLL